MDCARLLVGSFNIKFVFVDYKFVFVSFDNINRLFDV